MNKKLNTVLFFIITTVINLLLLSVIATILMLTFGLIYKDMEEISRGLSILTIIVILIGSIGLTFFLHSRIIKWAMNKWNLDAVMAPIFKGNRRE